MTLTLKDFMSLTKFHLSIAVTLATVFSFILVKKEISIELLFPLLGVMFLAFGVCALNQYQEYEDDAKMNRTKKRPIASHKITPQEGLFISLFLIAISYIFIWFSLEYLGFIIFTVVIVLYNFIYTKTKKLTVYAAVYGAILGTFPPLIGWLSGGGDIIDLQFLSIALFYLVWQIPHFWLLTLIYQNDYQKAGFKTVADEFGVQRLERITFIWLLLTLICGLFTLSLFPIKSTTIFSLILLLILYTFYSILVLRKKHNYRTVFLSINLYITLMLLLFVVDILIRTY